MVPTGCVVILGSFKPPIQAERWTIVRSIDKGLGLTAPSGFLVGFFMPLAPGVFQPLSSYPKAAARTVGETMQSVSCVNLRVSTKVEGYRSAMPTDWLLILVWLESEMKPKL